MGSEGEGEARGSASPPSRDEQMIITVKQRGKTFKLHLQRFLVNGSPFVQQKVEPIGRLNYNAGCSLNHYPEFSK